MTHKFNPTILRQYDIRGVVGKNLFSEDAYFLGKAFGSFLIDNNLKTVVVSFDGRESSPTLLKALTDGLTQTGCSVINIGIGPTPQCYFAVYELKCDAGIMITGSHNPANYNGFKVMLHNRPFFGDDIIKLGEIAEKGNFYEGSGNVDYIDLRERYINRILQDFNVVKDIRLGWDCGNGATGDIVKKLVTKIPGEHFLLYEKIDGTFPNHHPDPTEPHNLIDLQNLVLSKKLDYGIAFDGDGDRIGIIDDEGEILWGDQIMIILSRDLLTRNPGAKIIADVKTSKVLFDEIQKAGGIPIMWKTGHSLIKKKMQEEEALLAGEMSGHIFYKEKYYGFDDAIYVALRLIDILSKKNIPLSSIRKALPVTYATPEIRMEIEEEEKFPIMDRIKKILLSEKAKVNDIDGVRVDNSDGWFLLRASNTQNIIVARCESITKQGLDNLIQKMNSIFEMAKSG